MTYDPKRAWNIAATEITFPDNDGYFLYIKVPTAAGENTSEFIVDKGYVVPSRDAGYFICPWGYIHPPVGGVREYSPYWGNRRGAAAAYVYIAYASASDGTGFTMTFNAALDYIAIKATANPIASPAASDFAGLWKNYKGANGTNGQGVPVGGTTGQKLKKKSNTDYDTEWKNDQPALTAGTYNYAKVVVGADGFISSITNADMSTYQIGGWFSISRTTEYTGTSAITVGFASETHKNFIFNFSLRDASGNLLSKGLIAGYYSNNATPKGELNNIITFSSPYITNIALINSGSNLVLQFTFAAIPANYLIKGYFTKDG